MKNSTSSQVFSQPVVNSNNTKFTVGRPKINYLITILLVLFSCGAFQSMAQVTWQVQSDYFGERNAIAQPRTIRCMALSQDGASVYTGNIQSPNTGSTSLRKVKSTVLAIPGTDYVIFGNGMPGGTGTFGQVAGQPVYADQNGAPSKFEAWTATDNSPRGLATDDRGNVYVALNAAGFLKIYNSNLSAVLGTITGLTGISGVSVRKVGSIYYAYVVYSNFVRRYNVTNVASPVLDGSWTPVIPGYVSDGVCADVDGTAFLAGGNTVRRVDASGTVTHTVTITGATGIAIFQSKIYIIKRLTTFPAQPSIIVRYKADLTSAGPDIAIPELGAYTRGTIAQITSIDVNQAGRLYVGEENYTGADGLSAYTPPVTTFNPSPGPITGRIYLDRVLISSAVEPPVSNVQVTSTTNVNCFGQSTGSVTISFDNGFPPYSYSLNAGPDVPVAGSPFVISGLAANSYTVVVKDGGGSTSSTTFSISQPPALVVAPTNNGPIGYGNTLNLFANGSGGTGLINYSWTGPNSFSAAIANPSIINAQSNATGIYTVTATDANGCTANGNTNAIVYASDLYVNDGAQGGDVYTSAIGNDANPGTQALPFATIQHAISVAQAGNTIYVDAGTYSGSTGPDKQLTFLGANATISPNTGSRVAESILTDPQAFRPSTTSLVIIKGFKLTTTGGNPIDNYTTGAKIRLEKNLFDGCIGLFIANPDLLEVVDNRFKDLAVASAEGLFVAGNYNGSTGSTIDVHDNTWINGQVSGMNLSSVKGDVYHNSFTGIAYYGVLVANLCDLDINENVFSGITNPGLGSPTWGAGVRFYTPASGLITTITGNYFTNNYIGVGVRNVGGDGSLAGTTITVNKNSFSGNTEKNIRNQAAQTLNASCNWLGSNVPATVAATIDGPVNYTPYLNSGTDANSGAIGFQTNEVCTTCALLLTPSSTNATCPSLNNGSASVSVSGGSGSYTYLWSNAATTSSLTGLVAGGYSVTVTDITNGCTASTSVTISNNTTAGPVHNTNTLLNYCTIQAAIDDPLTLNNHTITVDAGMYDEDVTVSKSLNIKGAGAASTTIRGVIGGPSGSTVAVTANNVEVSGFTITRLGNNTTDWNNPNLNIPGVSVQGQSITGMKIHDNIITGNRTGIDVNNSNGHTIRNNRIIENRTGLIFRNQTDNITFTENEVTGNWTVGIVFLDGSGGINNPVQTAANCSFFNNNISGNWYGQIVDRQTGGSLPAPGGSLKNFSGNWFGSNTPVVTTANSTEPAYNVQIPVAFGGSAVAPGGQPDIAGPASANFDYTPYLNVGTDVNIETVALRGTFGFQGSFSNLWVTAASAQTGATTRIQEGINTVSGSTVNVTAGTYNENVIVNIPVTIIGAGMGATILTPSVACTGDGISITSSNVNISNLTVNNYTYGIRTSAATISLYKVESINNCLYGFTTNTGTNGLNILKCKFNNNIVGGWRLGTGDLVTNVTIDSTEVKTNGVGPNNGFGIFAAASTPAANVFDYITIKNSDFSDNLKKGMYFEKLNHALIENVLINNSGYDPAYNTNAGIDINLKYDAYTDIVIRNSSITNCGVLGAATDVKAPVAVTIKARNDGAYSGDPASLTGVVFRNNFVSGPVNGLRFGEFSQTNAGPAGNLVTENHFGNAYSNKAILNETTAPLTAECNWFGTTGAGAIASLVSGAVDYSPYLLNGTDNDLVTGGFQPVPASCGTSNDLYVNDVFAAGDHYTTAAGSDATGSGTTSAPYATMQKAISVALPGDKIWVDAGTYTLVSPVGVDKKIILFGSQGAVDARTRGVVAESIVDAGGLSGYPSTIFDVKPAGSESVIDGFTLKGATGGQGVGSIYMEIGSNGTTVKNNIIQNNHVGIFLANNSASKQTLITQNLFRNNTAAGPSSGHSIYADDFTAGTNLQNVLIKDNVFTNTSTVVDTWAVGLGNTSVTPWTTISFQNNQVNNHGRGMYLYGVSNSAITGNTFTGATNYAVGIFDATVSNSSLTITGNTFTGNLRGIYVDQSSIPVPAYTGTLAPTGNIFSGGTYALVNSAVAGTLTVINAVGNTYDGVLLDGSTTLTNIFTIADKVLDAVDVGVYGKINLRTGNQYVTVNSFYALGGTTSPLVQRAVNAASATHTVHVGPGTFTGQVEIAKDLTVLGQGVGVTTLLSPNTLPLSFTTSGVNKPVVFVHDAANVVINDLTVDGAGKGNANNRFQGIAYWNAGGTVEDCEVKAIRNAPIDGVQGGTGIFASADNGTARTLNIIHNSIYDFQKNGTSFSGANLTANVTNNTVTGAGAVNFIAQNGIQLSTGAAGSITNNTVSGFTYTPASVAATGILLFDAGGSVTTSGNTVNNAQVGIFYYQSNGNITANTINYTAASMGATPYWYGIDIEDGIALINQNTVNGGGNGAGIEADYVNGESTSMTAVNNFIKNTDEGFVIWTDGTGGTANCLINNNSITPSVTYAIHNYGTINHDATCNWYGTTSPAAVAALVSGPVTFAPFLLNGTDNSPATPGFQPVPGSCGFIPIVLSETHVNVPCNGSSTASIDLTVSGGTPGYTYAWTKTSSSFTATTQDLTGLSAGQYNVLVTDANGATATLSVTITQSTPLTITCPSNFTVNALQGQCSASIPYLGTATASGGCGSSVTITNNHPSSNYPVGTTNVVWKATDNLGNTSTCTQQVTVADNQAPVINCPANITQTISGNGCSKSVSVPAPSVSDNCTVTKLTWVMTGATTANSPASGTNTVGTQTFNAGTTTITYTATDATGNSNTCSFTVKIKETKAPVITCPGNKTVNPDAGVCYATNVDLGSASASDNCGAVTVTNDAPSQFPGGITTVTWTATDNSGNTAICTQKITVSDNQAPVITCPSSISQPGTGNNCNATISVPNPVTSDNCAVTKLTWAMTGATTASSPSSGTNYIGSKTFNTGITTVTYTAKDAAGNTTSCTFTVTVTSGVALSITCPPNKAVNANQGKCHATNVNLGSPTTTGCGTITVTNNAPSQYPIGVTTVTWTVTNSSGNTATCSQTVTVAAGNVALSISCPPNKSVNTNSGQCYATNVNLGAPTTTGCGALTVTNDAPSEYQLGTTPVTWTVTNSSGNTATCTQTVTVTASLSISCPPTAIVSANPNKCYATNVNIGTPVTTGCGILTVTNNAPSQFPLGNTTVTWKVKDASNNQKTCSQTVTIVDNQNPVITCPADITTAAPNGQCGKNVSTSNPSSTDNCGLVKQTWTMSGATTGSSPSTGFNVVGTKYFNCGTTTITYKVWDGAGNWGTCSFTVNVSGAPNCFNTTRLITLNNKNQHPGVAPEKMEVTAYPNPTENFFNLKIRSRNKETVEIRVFDMLGKLVQQERGAPEQTYHLGDHIVSGMYLVEVRQAGEISITKVVKQ